MIIDADPVVPAVLGTNQKINSLEDLKGKSMAIIKGTTGETMLLKLNAEKGWGVKTILAKDYPEAFMLVEQGRAEAVVSNEVLLGGIIAGVPANKFKLLTKIEVAPAELICLVYTKTDNEMIAQIKTTEQRIKSDGTLERLHKKWFNQPLASGANLNMVWTAEQKKLVFAK